MPWRALLLPILILQLAVARHQPQFLCASASSLVAAACCTGTADSVCPCCALVPGGVAPCCQDRPGPVAPTVPPIAQGPMIFKIHLPTAAFITTMADGFESGARLIPARHVVPYRSCDSFQAAYCVWRT
jgi:hypothetical protein